MQFSQMPGMEVLTSSKVHLIFDPETCTLDGTVLFPYTGYHDGIVWTVVSDVEIHGYFVTSVGGGRYLYSARSLDIIRYFGPEIPAVISL